MLMGSKQKTNYHVQTALHALIAWHKEIYQYLYELLNICFPTAREASAGFIRPAQASRLVGNKDE